MTKDRRHHNNTGLRQVKRGKTRDQVKLIALHLGLPMCAPPLALRKAKR